MTPIQPRTPTGTLELLPRDQMLFQHMIDVIRKGYERFGFVPVETPVFELRDVLLTKSGGETEKQVYFVQSTGAQKQGHEAELALRFDLTVPLARYVAARERELAFPFRRYQIQKVYRGERPQKGRFREFYQCDIDVIGKDALDPAYDAELPAIIVQIFEELGVGDFTIHFSNRKVLLGLLTGWGMADADKRVLAVREIDKLAKIGRENVVKALTDLGVGATEANQLLDLVTREGSNDETLAALDAMNSADAGFKEGVEELRQMVALLKALGVPEKRTKLDLSIARGLDYYTGTVYETLIDEHPEFGSVCSGGRYENLASHYTKSKLPGVGLSIGLTRLYDQLSDAGLLRPVPNTVQILITQFDVAERATYLALAADLRRAGYRVENYLAQAKLEKQLKYADKAGIPLVIIMGPDEKAKGTLIVKNLARKTQTEVTREEVRARLPELLA